MKQGTMNILFFILKTKLLKNGEAPILMRITIDGHYEEARIQRSVLPKQWDSATFLYLLRGRLMPSSLQCRHICL